MTEKVFKKLYIWILVAIFAGIVVHAPISVGLGIIWPGYELLIKSWKEILMLVAGVLFLYLMFKKKRYDLLDDRIIIAIFIYATLHLVSMLFINNGLAPVLAGLAIDLRYLLFFSLVYLYLKMYPKSDRLIFIKLGAWGAFTVVVFALLQVFVLPIDFLKYIGYSVNTISPYLTIDQNYDFVRINSTLRGPNPLGAYAGMVLMLIIAAFLKNKISNNKHTNGIVLLLFVGASVALWFSYSRSAMIATAISIGIILLLVFGRKVLNLKWLVSGVLITVVLALMAFSNQQFVSNFILHENPNDNNSINSNDGHVDSLVDGINLMISQPFGAGVGSTGSASLYGDKPLIIENQYLFIAHEVGWMGLGVFAYIFGLIMLMLWQAKNNWLALGVLASGVGMAFIGLLLPVWVDDTVAIIWFGVAAVALNYNNKKVV